MTNTLTLPLKGEYFDQIVAGTKTEEYRERTPYWAKRLVGREYTNLVITKGYPKRDDRSRRIELPYRGFVEKTIMHPHFGGSVDVFAIALTKDQVEE